MSGIDPPSPRPTAPDDSLNGPYARPLSPGHPDYATLRPIAAALIKCAGGTYDYLVEKTAALIRQAADEVIDTARTGRFTLAQCEKTEKTYLGTKIENLFRNMLGVSRGKLDLDLDGTAVDVKNTMHTNWAIPQEAYGHPCLLISENERNAKFSIGIVVAHPSYLNPGLNKDSKRGISTDGRTNIWWIAQQHDYPKNPWEFLPLADRAAIMEGSGGTVRVATLFEKIQDRPISRTMVAHVAQQKDPMKRIRRNGGARDILAQKQIAILEGGYDQVLIKALGLPQVTSDQFISHTPASADEYALLKSAGHID